MARLRPTLVILLLTITLAGCGGGTKDGQIPDDPAPLPKQGPSVSSQSGDKDATNSAPVD